MHIWSEARPVCPLPWRPASSEERNRRVQAGLPDWRGNQSIGQYLSVHKDSFSNPPTNRRLEEAVVVDWPKMMKFKAS
ncbi:hypothetical protein AVEN_196065-1 [Araneus ventricosus]|uniref:Uncharacterized protein n=1 Tax=Araneus ventricosus TaxID=182803 RepID=A0A4Y2NSY6_ARAVE|nr:hypothetical protein AVEN_196065-1 [Araneus ventricosus]